MTAEPRVVVIAGPTASGKSRVAATLADAVGGLIVNADSMQVYRDLRRLSARPSAEDEARTPHSLYGYVDGAERYSVGRWLPDALAAITEAQAQGRTPILVGGTGLYLSALTEGLAPAPQPDPAAQAAVRELAASGGTAVLHREALRLDPEATARIAPQDQRRLTRVIEVAWGTEHTLTVWRRMTRPALAPDAWRAFVVEPDRAALYAAINARAETIMEEGGVEEAATLARRGLPPDRPVMKALGVAPLAAYAAGGVPREAALARLQRDTRRYAKRQLTWLRHRATGWPRIAEPDADRAQAVLADAFAR